MEDKIMKKFLAVALSAALVAGLAAGCGSDSNDAGSGAKTAKVIDVDLTSEEYAFGVDKTQPELLDEVNAFIQKIKDDGTLEEIFDKYFGDGEPTPVQSAELDESKDQLVVATNAAFEPFEYMQGDSYVGVDMEIAALLADELGQELVIQNMDFDAVCLSVGQQKCDIAMAGLTISEDRKEKVDFSIEYCTAAQRIAVAIDDTTFDECKSKEDVDQVLQSLTAVKAGGANAQTGLYYLQGGADFGAAGVPSLEVLQYKKVSDAVQALAVGNIQIVCADRDVLELAVKGVNR